ncbi:F-box protein At2g40910-like [Papaver somniferum]|uniref:F-box protein At2g40910-like n=1 Tax=Papaver somniferum TaxID=3469 RepID=UPI000E6FB08F|nr:F-box protein At2g40910-like [Papaver somniferum]
MKMKRCGTYSVEVEEEKQEVVCQLGDELMAFEILSRLPIRSLMSFKCVSKNWQSTIQEDQHFIDYYLHSSGLNHHPSLLLVGKPRYTQQPRCLLTIELLTTSSDNEDGCVVSVGATSKWIAPSSLSQHRVSSLDGLVCFMDTDNYRACIYNVTTRESTPWIKSATKQQVDEEQALYKYSRLFLLRHEFGYDPATKEYKVVSLWRLCRRNRETDVKSVDVVGEVLTVRQNSWRKIYVVLPNNHLTMS